MEENKTDKECKYQKIVSKIVELIDNNLIEENGKEFETLRKYLLNDYSDLIDLRNRIKETTEDETPLYEEDHITLDHVLDSIECFIGIIEILKD